MARTTNAPRQDRTEGGSGRPAESELPRRAAVIGLPPRRAAAEAHGALAALALPIALPIALDAAESVDIDEEALASGAGAGDAIGAGGGVVVVVSASFLLQPARAATLKESAAMRLSERMEAPGLW